MVQQIRVLENIVIAARSDNINFNNLVHQVRPSILHNTSSSAVSSIAISPSASSQTIYSNVPSLNDLFQLVKEKRSQRYRGGHNDDNTKTQLVYSSREMEQQRAKHLSAALNMEIDTGYKEKYVMKIKYDACSHAQKVKHHLADLSIVLNLDDEREIRKYWCQVYIHLILIIFDRCSDAQRLTENYEKFDGFMINSPLQQKLLIFGLYDNKYQNFDFIYMALFGKNKSPVTQISKANILCTIRANDEIDPTEIYVTFFENECNCQEFYYILNMQMANLLTVCWERLDQFYILMEKREIMVLDQLPNISPFVLPKDILHIISKRSRVCYILEEDTIKRFGSHLKKFDNFFDYERNEKDITFTLVKTIRRIILDILTKIYALCLSENLYGLNQHLAMSDYSFACSGIGTYNTLHKRGVQNTGHNNLGEYKKQIKVTHLILNNRLLLTTPLCVVFNFRYDIAALRLIEIDCYNLNVNKKYDVFNAFVFDFQCRIKDLIADFIDRLGKDYMILNESFDLLPFNNN